MSETMRGASETEMETYRGRETYETQPYETTGYGQQAMETSGRGTEQPSMIERVERGLTGKQPEQAYGTRETEYGAGTGTGTGSLADTMRSTYSTRPALGTKYEEPKPSVGEKIKSMLPGHTEETRGYEQGRERYGTSETGYGGQRGYEQRGYEQGRGGQPSVMERVEATFTGRSAQEQHEYDAQQRRQRDMERARGPSTSEPGLMHQFVSGASTAMFGTPSKKTLGQRWNESIHEIRTSLTGRPAAGETTYTPMERSTYSQYPTQQRGTTRY